jgi:hypothetical protein
MKISEHANYLLNEFGRLQFDYAAYCKPYGESLRNEARNNLEEYIAEIEAERHWIPVSERLPKKTDTVLVLAGGVRVIATYHNKNKWELLWRISSEIYGVTHWMPLPQPPEVQE